MEIISAISKRISRCESVKGFKMRSVGYPGEVYFYAETGADTDFSTGGDRVRHHAETCQGNGPPCYAFPIWLRRQRTNQHCIR
jgi:hypothetical protein